MSKEPKVFTYSLTLFERLIFLELYPEKGDHTSLLLHEALSKKFITEEERKDIYQIKNVAACPICGAEQSFTGKDDAPSKCTTKGCKGTPRPTGGVTWRTKQEDGTPVPQEKEVTLGEMANHAITKALKELNEAEAEEPAQKTLYSKIVLGKDAELTPEEIDALILSPMPKEKK